MTTLPLVLVIGVDTPIGLTVVRELGLRGVAVHGVGCADSLSRASRYLTGFTVRPKGVEPALWLPGLIAQTGAKAVFAISETDLVSLSALGDAVAGCRILTPRAGPLGIVLDKGLTLAAAAAVGIDTPAAWQPRTADEPLPDGLGWPVVVKWADPIAVAGALDAAGIPLTKAEFASDEPALRALLGRYAALGQFPLVQRYAHGRGLGQMLHMAGGVATLRFQHERLHEIPPEGGVSTLCRAVPLDRHTEQMAKSEALLASIGWQGPAMVEYRHDPASGRYVLMEINGRFWGSQPLAFHCGAHFAWEVYRRALLGETSPAPAPRAGLRARFMIPETRRLIRLLRRTPIADPAFRARPLRDLLAWLLGFFDPRMRYYVFSLTDPGPFLADLANVIRQVVPAGIRRRAPSPPPRSGGSMSGNRLG